MRGRGSKRQSKTQRNRTSAPSSNSDPLQLDSQSTSPDSQLTPSDSQLNPSDFQQNLPDSQQSPLDSLQKPRTTAVTSSDVFAHIVVQPAPNKYRFRYKKECLARSAGTLPGATSTRTIKRYPTIEIGDHNGAVVLVSCITKDKPYRVHPHELVGRESCEKGICKVMVQPGEHVVPFNFGIQSSRICDAREALELRESIKIDPFKQGYGHKEDISSIDLKALRLCFQVYLKKESKYVVLGAPLVSNVIYDNKAINDFRIHDVSHCSGSIEGGTKVILTCEKVTKEGLRVTFFSDKDGKEDWWSDAKITFLHKQVAIVFHTPPFRHPGQTRNAPVYIQLRNNTEYSNAIPFEYIASNTEYYVDGKKRKKLKSTSSDHCTENLDFLNETSSHGVRFNSQPALVTPTLGYDMVISNEQNKQSNINKMIPESYNFLDLESNQPNESQLYNLDQNAVWYSNTQPTCLIQRPLETQYSYHVQNSPQTTSTRDETQAGLSQASSNYPQQVSSTSLTSFYEQYQDTITYEDTHEESKKNNFQASISYRPPSYRQGQESTSQMTTPSHQKSQMNLSQRESTFQKLQATSTSTPSFQQLQGTIELTSDYQQFQSATALTPSFQQLQGTSQMMPNIQPLQDQSLSSRFRQLQEQFTPSSQQLQQSSQLTQGFQQLQSSSQLHNTTRAGNLQDLAQMTSSFQQLQDSSQMAPSFPQLQDSSQMTPSFPQLQDSSQMTPSIQKLQDSSQMTPSFLQLQDSSQMTPSIQQLQDSSRMTPSFLQLQDSSRMTPSFLQLQDRCDQNNSTVTNIFSPETMNQMSCNMPDLVFTESDINELLEFPRSIVHKDGEMDVLTDQLEALHTSDLSDQSD